MSEIHFIGPDGVVSVERDEWHNDRGDGFIVAYNEKDVSGVADKFCIPADRVVYIDG